MANSSKPFKVYNYLSFIYTPALNWLFNGGRRRISEIVDYKDDVADFGCGPGSLCSFLDGEYYVGVDGAKNMIKIAEKKFSNHKFICADIEEWNSGKEFDVIVLAYVLSVTKNPPKLIENCRKQLKVGGRLIVVNYFSKNAMTKYLYKFSLGFHLGYRLDEQLFADHFSLKQQEGVNLFKMWDLLVYTKNEE